MAAGACLFGISLEGGHALLGSGRLLALGVEAGLDRGDLGIGIRQVLRHTLTFPQQLRLVLVQLGRLRLIKRERVGGTKREKDVNV